MRKKLIRIRLHGILKEQYPEFSVAADSVADAIQGWSQQTNMRFVPIDDKPIIDVIDYDTEEKLKKKVDENEEIEIHLVPRMQGGGGFGKILLGAALVGLSFTGVGAIAIGSVGLGSALFATGLGLLLAGVMQLFMKAPNLENSDDPEPSRYIGSIRNTTEIGTLIPKGYGRFMVAGHYLSVQVDAKDMVFGEFPETV